MKKYEKPIILANSDLSEGVYTASGGCYDVTAYITQSPQTGRGDFRIQVNAAHTGKHTSDSQVLTISFNKPVEHKEGGTYIAGNGSTTLTIKLDYHQNPTGNVGFNGLVVTSDAGLAITGCNLTCNV